LEALVTTPGKASQNRTIALTGTRQTRQITTDKEITVGVWDKVVRPGAFAPRVDDCFTAEQVQRLTTLRQRLASQPVHLDLGIDARRLEFARWLVEHGRLGEGVSPSARSEGAKWAAA